MMKIRWVTWWPIGYWIPRFEALARRPGVDLEVVFLDSSQVYYEPVDYLSGAQFNYRILRHGQSTSGFYKPSMHLRNPLPIVRGDENMKIVIQYADITCMMAASMARVKQMPYYLFVASTKHDRRIASRLNERLKRYMFRGAAGLLATGKLQEEYAREYAPKTPVGVIGNPVDTGLLREHARELLPCREGMRQQRGWGSDEFVVGYVGRLAPEKGLDTLLQSAAAIARSGKKIRLALIGNGPQQDELVGQARGLGVQVDFPGFLRGKELSAVYACLDAFVLPSLSEPWGLVVNEAMEFSLPVIVSDRVGARHLVDDGSNGFVFKAGEGAGLEQALARLAASDNLRKSMGHASSQRISAETVDHWTDAVLNAMYPQRSAWSPAA